MIENRNDHHIFRFSIIKKKKMSLFYNENCFFYGEVVTQILISNGF